MTSLKNTFLCLCLFTITFAFSQQEKIVPAEKVNLSALIKNVQIIKKDKETFKIIWWIPTEYWKLSLENSSMANSSYADEMIATFEAFTLVCIINTEMLPFGGFEARKTSKIQIKDNNGNTYNTVDESLIPEEYGAVLSMMKPMMADMFGQFGEQMEFHVFPKKAKDGSLIANPLSRGKFTVILNTEEFDFPLPLSSMVEKKICPKDKKLYNGTWNYCPTDGKKLKLQTK